MKKNDFLTMLGNNPDHDPYEYYVANPWNRICPENLTRYPDA